MGDEELVKFGGAEPILLSKVRDFHIEGAKVRCTTCWDILSVHTSGKSGIRQHPHLKTIICKKCLEYYGSGDFSQDDDGDNYCRWCAEGGHLIRCDSCQNAFCINCIKRNLGRVEQKNIMNEKVWQCFRCDPSPLKPHENASIVIMNYIKKKYKRKSHSKIVKEKVSIQQNSESSVESVDVKECWLDKHFPRIVNSLDTDKRTILKLKSRLESHKDIPHRVHRCGLKLSSYLKQHIEECGTLLESLNKDNIEHECSNQAVNSADGTQEDSPLVEKPPISSISLSPEDKVEKENEPLNIESTQDINTLEPIKKDSSGESDLNDKLKEPTVNSTTNSPEPNPIVLLDEVEDPNKTLTKVNEENFPNIKDKVISDEELEINKEKTRQSRREKLSSSYRKKFGSPKSRSDTVSVDSSPSNSCTSPVSLTASTTIFSTPMKPTNTSDDEDNIILVKTVSGPDLKKQLADFDKESDNTSKDLLHDTILLTTPDKDEAKNKDCEKSVLNKLSQDIVTTKTPLTPPLTSLLVKNLDDSDDVKELNENHGTLVSKETFSKLQLSESNAVLTEANDSSGNEPLDITAPLKTPDDSESLVLKKKNLKSLRLSSIKKGLTPEFVPDDLSDSEDEVKETEKSKTLQEANANGLLESTTIESELPDSEKKEVLSPNRKLRKRTEAVKNEAAKKELINGLLKDKTDSDAETKKQAKSKTNDSALFLDSSDDSNDIKLSKLKQKNNSKDKAKKSTNATDFSDESISSETQKQVKAVIDNLDEEKNEIKEGQGTDVAKEKSYSSLENLLLEDDKIRSQVKVIVKKMSDGLINRFVNGEIKSLKPICKNELDSDDDLSLLDRKIARLAELPSKNALKNSTNNRSVKVSPKRKVVTPVKSNPAESSSSESSSDDSESSQASLKKNILKIINEDEEEKENLNVTTKEALLNDAISEKSDESMSSLDSGKIKKEKSKRKRVAKDSDSTDHKSEESKGKHSNFSSDEDFVIKKKRPKYDKLLSIQLEDSSNNSVKSEKSNKSKANPDSKNKKSSKRKAVVKNLDSSDSSESSSVSSIVSADEEKKTKGKKAQPKKRRRIKKVSDSSKSDSDVKEVDTDDDAQGTPGKGRKNIRKVVGEKNLEKATKQAALAEKERRKRVIDRQKHYNTITEGAAENGDFVTRKLVLEVHKESKEELVEVPEEILEKLKPHQVNGVKFMWECVIESLAQLSDKKGSGCVLAHCMGLGKTLQVITFLATLLTNTNINKHIKRAMVVCPYNTILNWAHEFKYWLKSTDCKINVYQMSTTKTSYERADLLERWHRKGGALIIGYDSYRNLTQVKGRGRVPKSVKETFFRCLVDPGPDIVICDEGHILKNSSSAIAKAMNNVRTGRRIVLTGTPLQNNLKEYHTMVHFVKPHLIGTEKEFRNRFMNPINNGQCADSTPQDVKLMKKRVHILHKLLEGCVQRCDYGHVNKFLPPKHEYVLSIRLSDKQIALYSHYLENYAMNKSNGQIEASGKQLFKDFAILRLIWTHPLLMKMNQKRVDAREALKDEELEDDGSSLGSFIDDRSDPCSSSSESVQELDNPKPSTSKADGEKKSKKKNSGESSSGDEDENSGEEVITKWKSRKRDPNNKPQEEEPIAPTLLWWQKIVPEEDMLKLEMSGKMIVLFDILKECSAMGDKVLLFSQSLLTLDLIEELLSLEDAKIQESCIVDNIVNNSQEGEGNDTEASKTEDDAIRSWSQGLDYFRMDGQTSADLRKKWIEIFNDSSNERARLFLISTKAGSLGTNLIGANRVILMDASWNPTHDVQAIFRVYRFGQVKPVYIYRFLAQGTMEEKIYDRQVTKQSLACRVVDEQQIERHFNAADLAELYSFTPESRSKRPTPKMPKDRLLADMLFRHKNWIVSYHEHDSLLQNLTDEDLTEEERKSAWTEYENEREGINQMTNEFAAAAAGGTSVAQLPSAEKIVADVKSKYPQMNDLTILQILSNYITHAQKKKQAAIQTASLFTKAGQGIPHQLQQEIYGYTQYITEIHMYCKNLRDEIARKSTTQDKYNQQMYAQQQAQQQAQRLQAQFQARFQQFQTQQGQQMPRQRFPTTQQFQQQMRMNNPFGTQTSRNYAPASYSRTGISAGARLAASNTAESVNNLSKLLNQLKNRSINVNVTNTNNKPEPGGYSVSYESPVKPKPKTTPGPIITEVDDDHPVPSSSKNYSAPLITEID